MDKKIHRVHTPSFKTHVILSMLKGDKTRREIASEFGIHPTQADKWKQIVLSALPVLFTDGKGDELYKQLGN